MIRVTSILLACLALASHAMALDVNVKTNYNAQGNGVTDDTAAFQQALNAVAQAGGGNVYAPRGNYRINGTLSIHKNVTLSGVASAPTAWSENEGTTLLAYAGRGDAEGTPFISLTSSNATLKGLTIYYPEQVTDSTPVVYPWCIDSVAGDNHTVLDCLLVNPYLGMRMHGAGRHYIRNVYGQPFAIGLSVDLVLDVGRVENVHFWPFAAPWDKDNDLYQWMYEHSVAFEFARTDWQAVTNTFCFGYGVGYRFFRSQHGVMNGSLLGIAADYCRVAIQVEDCEAIGVLITNGQFVGNWGENALGLHVQGTHNGVISFSNCSFWGSSRNIAVMEALGRLSFDNCHFKQWDKHNQGEYAIVHHRGSLSVQGCQFWSPGNDIHVGPNARAAFIIGNESEDRLNVHNEIGARAQISLNTGWRQPPEDTPTPEE